MAGERRSAASCNISYSRRQQHEGATSVRRRYDQDGLTINVIASTHVVFFGLDLAKPKRAGFRGFGFKRFEAETGETIWLRGMKTFEATEPFPVKGEMFRSAITHFNRSSGPTTASSRARSTATRSSRCTASRRFETDRAGTGDLDRDGKWPHALGVLQSRFGGDSRVCSAVREQAAG